jgi:hypothetical protein
MIAYEKVSNPPISATLLILVVCNKSSMSLGTTGMINPRPVTSINKVMKINPIAALRFFTMNTSLYALQKKAF